MPPPPQQDRPTVQMQYPLPSPWQVGRPRGRRRMIKLGMKNPRFLHLPLVRPTANGEPDVVRGGTDTLWERVKTDPAFRDLYRPVKQRPAYFVAENRLGRIRYVCATAPVPVAVIEQALWTHWYRVPDTIVFQPEHVIDEPTVSVAATLDSYEDILRAELRRVRKLRRDGWVMHPVGLQGRLLVDATRPVEDLTDYDLPDGPIE